MDSEKIGQFIQELRKQNQLTQKELAAKLNVSDKAVSKWERGLSCPDISLLSPLSEIFSITTTELLNGERNGLETVNVEEIVVNALEYGKKTAKRKIELDQNIIAAVFSILLLVGIFVVLVVDMAISRALTWSLIPITASVFAWLVFFPALKFGTKGIIATFISFSVFIVPFLFILDYVIDRLLKSDIILFDIGVRIAPLAIVFFWIVYILLKKLKTRILLAVSIIVLLISPANFLTNAMIASVLNEPYTGIEVIINTFSPALIAVILFIIDSVRRNSKHQES